MNKKIKKLVRFSGCNTKRVVVGVAPYRNLDSDFENFSKLLVEETLEVVKSAVDELTFSQIEHNVKVKFGFEDETLHSSP